MIGVDLHIHSRHSSDGEFGVADIINRCVDRKIDVFSITDHNSVKGIDEAVCQTRQIGLNFISGIEIDCNYDGTNLHLLGYNIDWRSADFCKLEDDIRPKEMDAFAEMIDNLRKIGFVIDSDAVLAKADGALPTAELIAEVMLSDQKYYSPLLAPYMKGGCRGDMPYINFYLDYFAQGKPAFVPVDYIGFCDAVELIRGNGGVPVVAHAGLNFKGRERTVEALLDRGAVGLEVFNNYHSAEQIDYFGSLVQKRGCLMTCGSDFHGKTKPLIDIGLFNSDPRFDYYLNNSIKRLKDMISM